ncbi:MAG: glycosyltransferase [Actinomycetota bacterium]|nr:glycosyltransferase [Actinomycetota bacterium]
MPRLSVLVPARNSAATIEPALRSTLRAMPADSELVVLDDASEDRTAEVIARIPDPRLRLLRNDVQGGVAAGLNRMLEATDSELVARMDADDLVLPWRFRTQLPALELADVVFTTVFDWRGSRVRPPAPVALPPNAFGLHLLVTNPVSHPTMLARRSALAAVDGYRDVPAEDYDLWLRLELAGSRQTRLAVPTLAYRIHEHQVTASTDWRHASWRDAQVAVAYRALSERLLGQPFLRLPVLATLTATAERFEADLTRFVTAMDAASAALPANQRRFLLRKLQRRVHVARALRNPVPALA